MSSDSESDYDENEHCGICDKKVLKGLKPVFDERYGKVSYMCCSKCIKLQCVEGAEDQLYGFKYGGTMLYYTFEWCIKYKNPYGHDIFNINEVDIERSYDREISNEDRILILDRVDAYYKMSTKDRKLKLIEIRNQSNKSVFETMEANRRNNVNTTYK